MALIAVTAARFCELGRSTTGRGIDGRWDRGPVIRKTQARGWLDHVPIFGWFVLRRETAVHGRGYWFRPLSDRAVLSGVHCLVLLHVRDGAVCFPAQIGAGAIPPRLDAHLHWQFLAHFVLFTLMTIATFIDFDEQSIPDFITVPGTVIGLLGAAFAPAWLPFHQPLAVAGPAIALEELHAGVPNAWPTWLNGRMGLWFGLLILLVWGFALLDRRWITRRGSVKAIQYFFARLLRTRSLWLTVLCVTTCLMLLVVFSWFNLNGPTGRWKYLLSSLFGLAFAGGVTWAVRVSATAGLGVEALGFGDVTLMAMIGTYVGWQPSLLVFFIAPLVAILFVLIRAIITGDTATPYGPYLCAAAVLVLVYWNELWAEWAARVFALGPAIVGIVVACVALMGVLLWIWQLIKQLTGLAGH